MKTKTITDLKTVDHYNPDNAFEVIADEGTEGIHEGHPGELLAGSSVTGSLLRQFGKHSVKMPDMRYIFGVTELQKRRGPL